MIVKPYMVLSICHTLYVDLPFSIDMGVREIDCFFMLKIVIGHFLMMWYGFNMHHKNAITVFYIIIIVSDSGNFL